MPASEKIVFMFFMLLVGSVYILEAAVIVVFALNRLRDGPRKIIVGRKVAIVIHSVAAIGLICILYGYFIEPYWIEVNTVSIQTDKLRTTTFRIVHISDLHCETKPRNEKKMVELINGIEPEIIVFTGDALNERGALPIFKDTMSNLKASLAKFAIYGNFEMGNHRGLDHYSGTGFQVLDAETAAVTKNGETIRISGLNPGNPAGFKGLMSEVAKEDFSIFLYHFSDLVESAPGLNLDLYLCGHTHGGQVALPLYGAIITLSKFGKKYESGLYKVNDTTLYVNRGIGLEASPAPKVRFLARPEITVFEIGPMP